MRERILIADYDDDLTSLLSKLLLTKGFEVISALDVEEANKKITNKRPDIIVADINIAQEIPIAQPLTSRKSHESLLPSLIILSHKRDKERLIPYLKKIANYILKPIDTPELFLFRVNQTVNQRELIKKNRLLSSQLRKLAIKDPLTDLYNYRHLHHKVSEEITRSRRYNRKFCLLLFDIDSFKQFNQEFGHLAGNYVLQQVAQILRDNVRIVDTVFRYGADQFVVVMPETQKDSVLGIAMRLMLKIRDYPFIYNGHTFNIAVSLGCSAYPEDGNDKAKLLVSLEHALSKAKQLGGDTIFFE